MVSLCTSRPRRAQYLIDEINWQSTVFWSLAKAQTALECEFLPKWTQFCVRKCQQGHWEYGFQRQRNKQYTVCFCFNIWVIHIISQQKRKFISLANFAQKYFFSSANFQIFVLCLKKISTYSFTLFWQKLRLFPWPIFAQPLSVSSPISSTTKVFEK